MRAREAPLRNSGRGQGSVCGLGESRSGPANAGQRACHAPHARGRGVDVIRSPLEHDGALAKFTVTKRPFLVLRAEPIRMLSCLAAIDHTAAVTQGAS